MYSGTISYNKNCTFNITHNITLASFDWKLMNTKIIYEKRDLLHIMKQRSLIWCFSVV